MHFIQTKPVGSFKIQINGSVIDTTTQLEDWRLTQSVDSVVLSSKEDKRQHLKAANIPQDMFTIPIRLWYLGI